MKLSIVCLNTFGLPFILNKNTRFKLIAQELQKMSPDIISLQEVWMPNERAILIEKLKKDYDYSPKSYASFNNCGLLTFFKKGINFKSTLLKRFKNQGPFNLLCLPDRIGGKGFEAFEVKIDDKKLNFINSHTMCQYNRTNPIKKSYIEQINELSGYLLTLENKLIVSGDLNDVPDSVGIAYLKNRNILFEKLKDSDLTVDLQNLNRGKMLNIFANGKSYRTDYILVSNTLKINCQNIVFNEVVNHAEKSYNLSDHYGVYTEIEI